MRPQWTEAKDFLENVRKEASECGRPGASRSCYYNVISSIRAECRYWAAIEHETNCPEFAKLRMKAVSWINKQRDVVIDALVRFFERDLPGPDGNANVVVAGPEKTVPKVNLLLDLAI